MSGTSISKTRESAKCKGVFLYQLKDYLSVLKPGVGRNKGKLKVETVARQDGFKLMLSYN